MQENLQDMTPEEIEATRMIDEPQHIECDCGFEFDMMDWAAPATVADPFGADPMAQS